MRIIRKLAAGAVGAATLLAFAVPGTATAAETQTITPNPWYQSDTFKGWGTSLAWYANAAGHYALSDNAYAQQLADDFYDLLFSEDGLDLQSVRYNIGGGNASDVTDYLRPGAAVEGWWKANPEGDGHSDTLYGGASTTLANKSTILKQWDPDNADDYDYDADASQRWWLEKLQKNKQVKNWEFFSNSAPYFMTNSGYVSGHWAGSTDDQLAGDGTEDADAANNATVKFAKYLAHVTKYLKDTYDITPDTIEPLNEPNDCTNCWVTNNKDGKPSARQEGMSVKPDQQTRLIKALREALDAQGLTATKDGKQLVSAMDASSSGTFRFDYTGSNNNGNGYAQNASNWDETLGQFNTHGYGDQSYAPWIRDVAKTNDKPLMMSEYEGDYSGSGFDPYNFKNGMNFAKNLNSQMRQYEPNSWVLWQPVEDYYNMEQDAAHGGENLNWGSVYIDFDCQVYTKENGDKVFASTRRVNNLYGGVNADGKVADNVPACTTQTNSKFNVLKNYTHFIQAGDHVIATDSTDATAAVRSSDKSLRLVITNSGAERSQTIDLSGFANVDADAVAKTYVTTAADKTSGDPTANTLVHDDKDNVAVDADAKSVTVDVPANSVTTIVVTGVSGVSADAAQIASGAQYQLIGKQSGKALNIDANGTATIQNTASAADKKKTQTFTLTEVTDDVFKTRPADRAYVITNADGKVVTVSGGDPLSDDSGAITLSDTLTVETAKNDSSAVWILNSKDGKHFSFLNKKAVKTLDVNGGGTAAGTSVIAWRSTEGDGQAWQLKPAVNKPVTYTKYQGIADPTLFDANLSNAGYFQPQWTDDKGNHIQAHGGQIMTTTEKKDGKDVTVYWWYGEDRSNGYYKSPGVHVYKSYDTKNWEDQGLALRSATRLAQFTDTSNDDFAYFDKVYDLKNTDGTVNTDKARKIFYYLNMDPDQNGDGTADDTTAIIERPKVIHNEKTGKYVMWWHADGSTKVGGGTYDRAMAGVAVADSPAGPFKLVGAYRLPNRWDRRSDTEAGMSRDMTVFKDSNGDAYLVYSSEGNWTLYAAKLDDTYTNTVKTTTTAPFDFEYSSDGKYPLVYDEKDGDSGAGVLVEGQDYKLIKKNLMIEAPAVFETNGRYYIVASAATGWAPNQATYYTADSMLGDWTRGVDKTDGYENTWIQTQKVPEGTDGWLAYGDTNSTTFGSQSTNVLALDASKGQYVYMGDRWYAKNNDDGSTLGDSTYVWLPLTFGENGRLEMRNPAAQDNGKWSKGWDASYWQSHGGSKTAVTYWTVTDDGLADLGSLAAGEDVSAKLPAEVSVKDGDGKAAQVAVTWSDVDTSKSGKVTVTGTLAGDDAFYPGRTFTREITVEDPNCPAAKDPWKSGTFGANAGTICQTSTTAKDYGFTIADGANGGAWASKNEYSLAYRADALKTGESLTATVSGFEAGGNSDARAGIVVRNDLSASGQNSAKGYAMLILSQNGLFWQNDTDGNGYIDWETADADKNKSVTASTVADGTPVTIRVTRVDADTFEGFYRNADGTFVSIGTVDVKGADSDGLDVGVLTSANNGQDGAKVTYTGVDLSSDEAAPKDTTAPVISGADDVTLDYGAAFDPKAGVSAKDDVDGNLTKDITVTGTVDTSKAGTYELTYTVADKAGNTVTVTRTVTVRPKPVTPVEVDKTDLDKALADAADLDQNDYTSDTWGTFKAAYDAAKAVSEDKNATQAQVDAAYESLAKAKDGLKKADPGTNPSTPDNPDAGDGKGEHGGDLKPANGSNATALSKTGSAALIPAAIAIVLLTVGAVLLLGAKRDR
ncbi:immunoglobulin-like domain-containing protein [Bifidobacterium saguinibicoloris]|uniref:immunoglobulin-like domain-containing protein n=1 Tax=Bifidobacterium saguinibicoloris TaxID=2834433 RepID=UPI001C58FD46|nr:immunoglobulin-like domain-containing protein [Bifidobacterium saguinibicoloris]MBW3081619.1 DUF5011 domain-containing protein [Bifidobacterium saguinibicoloris]